MLKSDSFSKNFKRAVQTSGIMKAMKLSFESNPNIGTGIFVSNKLGLIGKSYEKRFKKELESLFGVPFYGITFAGTDLIGVFIAGNDDLIVIPDICFKEELKEIRSICEKHEAKLIISEDRSTALGNLALIGKEKAILSAEICDKTAETIKKEAKLKIIKAENFSSPLVGSLVSKNSTKAVTSPALSEEEIKLISKAFGIECIKMSVNFGNNFVSSGLVMNDSGYAIGEHSTAVEIYEIDNFLRE